MFSMTEHIDTKKKKVFRALLHPDKVSASNTYNNIASFVYVDLDCIQFDYIL
jgi:hypothetical protein